MVRSSKFKLFAVLTLVSLIVILGLRFRMRGHDFFPPVQSTFDEHFIAWTGSSLINNGVPTSWSFVYGYESSNSGHLVDIDGWGINYDNRQPRLESYSTFPKPLSHRIQFKLDGYETQFTLVQPQIEQPPLAGVISSFLSGTYKKSSFEQTSISDLRVPVVILSSLAAILVFIISYLAFKDLSVSLLSSLIYSLTPTLIVSQRLAVAENYLTIFYLLGTISTQLFIRSNKLKYLLAASLLVFLGYLTKPFGVSLSILIIFSILYFKKPLVHIIYPLIAAFLGIITYFVYGVYIGGQELFTKIVEYQGNRLSTPLNGILKIVLPRIGSEIFLDGWVILGWLSLLRSHFWVIAPVVSYLLVLFIYGGEDYGWYRLPVYPFLSIATAFLLIEIIKKREVLMGLIFLITAFATSLFWGLYTFDWRSNTQIFRVIMLVVVGLLATGYLQNKKLYYIFPITFIILILISLYLNIQTVNNMNLIWPTLRDLTSVIPMRH